MCFSYPVITLLSFYRNPKDHGQNLNILFWESNMDPVLVTEKWATHSQCAAKELKVLSSLPKILLARSS